MVRAIAVPLFFCRNLFEIAEKARSEKIARTRFVGTAKEVSARECWIRVEVDVPMLKYLADSVEDILVAEFEKEDCYLPSFPLTRCQEENGIRKLAGKQRQIWPSAGTRPRDHLQLPIPL
jgi:hypothetical protein